MDLLHDQLAQAGQSLRSDEMISFLAEARSNREEVVGAIKGEIAFTSLHVSELWVKQTHRGTGLGTKLLMRAEAFALQKDCDRIHLETRNIGARKLYEKLGYTVFGTLDNYNGSQDFWYLTKAL
ncbi:MAG: GNAT family N-acetyltransferase [Pseudomonadota bacterium]